MVDNPDKYLQPYQQPMMPRPDLIADPPISRDDLPPASDTAAFPPTTEFTRPGPSYTPAIASLGLRDELRPGQEAPAAEHPTSSTEITAAGELAITASQATPSGDEHPAVRPPRVEVIEPAPTLPGGSEFFGAGARALPGPEIVPTLDPAAHIRYKPHILTVPNRSDLLVRLYPKAGADPTAENRERLGWINSRQTSHWQTFVDKSEGKMQVPSFRSFVRDIPDSLRRPPGRPITGELALFSVVDRVEGEPLPDSNAFRDPRGLPFLYGATKYLEGLLSVKNGEFPEEFLGDIYDPRQSRGGHLVDVEPVLTPLTMPDFEDAVNQLTEWLEDIGSRNNPLRAETYDVLRRMKDGDLAAKVRQLPMRGSEEVERILRRSGWRTWGSSPVPNRVNLLK